MANKVNVLYNMRLFDDLASQDTVIHRIHPLMKLLTTIGYLIVVVSFGRYDLGGMFPLLVYPVVIFVLADLPLKPILVRILLVSPLIIGIGILNPVFDRQPVLLLGTEVAQGWITFLSLLLKGGLTVTAGLLLMATTRLDVLAGALRLLKIPRVFVLQLLLTYRYISVLLEEAARTLRAYALRAPGQKGIKRYAWGSLSGQLLLRTYDRAQRVYEAMCLRGFDGEYYSGVIPRTKARDLVYLAGWVLFFALVRYYDIPLLMGSMLLGVVK